MTNDDTQIVLLDEWSENTLQADLAKTVFQGGYMVTAAKYGEARAIINRSPLCITTNQVPKFGADDVNVKGRIVVFETKTLPKTDTKAEDWIRRNAMKCIHWTISEIEKHYSEFELEELLAFFWEFFRGGGQNLLLCYCFRTKFQGGAKVFRGANCLMGAPPCPPVEESQTLV